MKLRLHSHHRSLLAGLLALCLALAAFAGFATQAGATSHAPRAPGAGFMIPDEGVAIAQIATVRIVAHYTFTYTLGPVSGKTVIGSCTGLGVLLQSSSGTSQAESTYLLTTSAVLSKDTPCSDATLGLPANYKSLTVIFSGADVYFSTAYSGLGHAPIKLQIKDASALLPNLTTSNALIVAVVTASLGTTFPHDYPTVALATSQGTAGQVIDLKNSSGTASLTSKDLNGPPPPATDPSSQYLTPAQAMPFSPTLAADTTSLGAPVVDTTTGALVGLVNFVSSVPTVIAVAGQISALPNASTACPGPSSPVNMNCLSYKWQQAVNRYYTATSDKEKQQAKTTIAGLASEYSDFQGASDFATAIPSPTSTKTTTPQPTTSSGGSGGFLDSLKQNTPELIGVIVLVVLLILVFIMTLMISVRRMRRKGDQAQAMQGAAFPTRSRPSGQIDPGYGLPPGANPAASYPPVSPPNGAPRRTIVCQRCGAQNHLGASNCANCGADLPQGVAGVSGVGQSFGRSTSGGPLPLSLPTLNPPPAPTPDVSEMPTLTYPNQGASNAELERTLPTMPAVGSARQEEATIVMRKRQPLGIKVSTKSDAGRRRAGKANEDNFLAVTGTWKHNGQLQPFGLFVIADGMGGHANGQDASRMAVETIYQHLSENLPQQDIPDEKLGEFLQQAIQRANQMIYHQNQKDHADMGCTMTAAIVTGNEAHICNVGDSRTYLLTPHDHLQRVTTDHSIVQSLVDAGVIQKDDVYTHPKRNQIYRSLGEKETQDIDLYHQRLGAGDKLLLCCDGLWEMIRDPEIEQTMRQDDLPQVTSKLIEMANENGGVDNITAIVVKVMEDAKPAKQPKIESVASGPARLEQPQR